LPHYLYQIRPVRLGLLTEGATPEESRLVGEHFEYLRDLYERGIATLVGRTLTTGPETLGLMVFAAADEREAQQIAARDPAVGRGVFAATLLPFKLIFPEPTSP
jgi:uncharacterized protein YciI